MTTRVEFRKATIVGPNPGRFADPIVLRLQVEVFEKPPSEPIDVKFTWSPIWDFSVDQTLDELEVGPLATLGKQEFTIESDPPNVAEIPDPTGPTALLVSLSYKGREFMHLGFNVAVTCDGELPEVFTSADPLRREIGRCYAKQTAISWDDVTPTCEPGPTANMSSAEDDDDEEDDSGDDGSSPHEPAEEPTKKVRHESDSV